MSPAHSGTTTAPKRSAELRRHGPHSDPRKRRARHERPRTRYEKTCTAAD
ncbi:hypothetical protein FTUN_0266 [Frigoriglobus tundricola]|uniref:Uncharacterized protein n=1 Tax=Frigoriglobus tundricola TaxID=2774151 RepID=A0A6M5YFI4_9BACT|nr:hypothetical protein FTUN_0266 [Frigoriglobus tundricola]